MAKVLVLDDRADNWEFLVKMLGHLGHTVVVQASDGMIDLVGDMVDPAAFGRRNVP
jgi:CheY-like chemotaxis protein